MIWRKSKEYAPEIISAQPGEIAALRENNTAVGNVSYKNSTRIVLWWQGKSLILGKPTDEEGFAQSVNSAGVVVGYRGSVKDPRVFRSTNHAAMWKQGRLIALPELGTEQTDKSGKKSQCLSDCVAINDEGVAVGWSEGLGERRACLWRDGLVEALSLPEGYSSKAYAINKSGVVVGEARDEKKTEGRRVGACIWQEGKWEDLNNLIPADSGWELWTAQSISENGLTVGIGRSKKFPNDACRAFLLVPMSR